MPDLHPSTTIGHQLFLWPRNGDNKVQATLLLPRLLHQTSINVPFQSPHFFSLFLLLTSVT